MGGPGSGSHSWRRLPRNLVERAFMLDLAALHRVREATGTITTGQLILDRLIQRGLVSVEGEQAFINERGRIALSCALENS
jgi:hypothetical protein